MSDPTRHALIAGATIAGFTATAAAQARSHEPIEANQGATILGPRNPDIAAQNKDLLTPRATDHGTMANLHFSFAATT